MDKRKEIIEKMDTVDSLRLGIYATEKMNNDDSDQMKKYLHDRKMGRIYYHDNFVSDAENYNADAKLCFICSPYGATEDAVLENNLAYARELVELSISLGYVPIATHFYLSEAFDDNRKMTRYMGIRSGLCIIPRCDAMLIGNLYGITEGMKIEIQQAQKIPEMKLMYHVPQIKK